MSEKPSKLELWQNYAEQNLKETQDQEEKETNLDNIEAGKTLEIETENSKYIIEKREDGFYIGLPNNEFQRTNLGSIYKSEKDETIKPNVIRLEWYLTFDINGVDIDGGLIKSIRFIN
jgi:hypothetical protein